jgi:hypothetical protein
VSNVVVEVIEQAFVLPVVEIRVGVVIESPDLVECVSINDTISIFGEFLGCSRKSISSFTSNDVREVGLIWVCACSGSRVCSLGCGVIIKDTTIIIKSTDEKLATNVLHNVETDGHENLAWVFMVGNSSPQSVLNLSDFTVKGSDSVFSELFKTVGHV